MFKEITENAEFLPYKDYLRSGGLFTEADYRLIGEVINGKSLLDYKIRPSETAQITDYASLCGIQVTPFEIHIYNILSIKMPTEEEIQKPDGSHFVPVWKMPDQELVRQIFLAEGKREEYQIITSKYPNIFK
jgi:hypothetical protein